MTDVGFALATLTLSLSSSQILVAAFASAADAVRKMRLSVEGKKVHK